MLRILGASSAEGKKGLFEAVIGLMLAGASGASAALTVTRGTAMKRWGSAVLAFAAIVLIGLEAANAGVIVTWDAATGLLPDQIGQPFTLIDEATPEVPVLSGGVLTLSGDQFIERMFYNDQSLDFTFPLVIEADLRVVSGSATSATRAPAMIFGVLDDSTTFLFGIGVDRIFLTPELGSVVDDEAFVDTDDAFHTYRIEVAANGSIEVFYDDVSTLTGSSFVSASLPGISWGEASISALGTSEWTMFSHNAGVPEPTTALLLASGLVGLAVRSRRH